MGGNVTTRTERIMGPEDIESLRTGFINAVSALNNLTFEEKYNPDHIYWLNSEKATDLFTSLEADIKREIIYLSDSHEKLKQYTRQVYYEVLGYSLRKFRLVSDQWLEIKSVEFTEAIKDNNFLIIHNGYISAISRMMAIFRKELMASAGASIPEDFSITGDYSKEVEILFNSKDRKQPEFKTLFDAFVSPERYQFIINHLVNKKICNPGNYHWLDRKEILIGLLKHLGIQGYYHRELSQKEMITICKYTFSTEVSVRTCNTKPENVSLPNIPPASTLS